MPCDLKIPRTPRPILPVVWWKKVFCFFHSSASGKPHLSYSSSQKEVEKASNKNVQKYGGASFMLKDLF